MAVLYVHIGMPKTGTTAIQEFLFHNADGLKKQHAVYPDFGLRFQWVSASRNAYWLSTKGYTEETAEKCFAQINDLADTYEKIILSDEVLWLRMGFQKSFWQNLKEHLRDDIEIKMVTYLRRQDLYVYSWWSQQVKVQQPISYKTYPFSQYLSSGVDKMNRLDYQEYLQAGIEELGAENLLVRTFEHGRFAGGSLYADFFDGIGLTLTDDFEIPEQLTNITIRGNVLEAKRYLNYLPEFSQKGFRILPYLEKTQGLMEEEHTLRVRNDFPKQEREVYLQQFQASNEWVARNLCGEADGVLFHEPVKDGEGTPAEYTTREVADVCGNMMLEMMRDINRQKQKIAEQKQKIAEQKQKIAEQKQTIDEQQQTITQMEKVSNSGIGRLLKGRSGKSGK